MPTLNIVTNVPSDSLKTSEIIKDCSKVVAAGTGKPESYVMISLRASTPMSFGGTEEPTAFAQLFNIGSLKGKTENLSKKLSEIVKSKLGVPPERFYISFQESEGYLWGFNGGTF
eukprot:jgi/Mesvir1/23551/Mv18248-RA.1